MFDAFMNFVDSWMNNWYFMGACIFLLLVLGGFLVYRLFFSKKDDDE